MAVAEKRPAKRRRSTIDRLSAMIGLGDLRGSYSSRQGVLFFGQRPDTVPIVARRGSAEPIDAGKEDLAWPIAGNDPKAAFEGGPRRFPIPAAIDFQRPAERISKLKSLASDFALAAEEFEDPLWLGFACDQHRVDFARLY